jgi:hypothetical protein
MVTNLLLNGTRKVVGSMYTNGDPANATIASSSVAGILRCVIGDTIGSQLQTFANVTALNDIITGGSGFGTTLFISRIGD